MLNTFVEDVEKIGAEYANDERGYLMFAYEQKADGTQTNTFSSKSTMANLAECLFTCMSNSPMLANVVMAAGNAYAQKMMAEAQATAAKEQPKKTRKNKKHIS